MLLPRTDKIFHVIMYLMILGNLLHQPHIYGCYDANHPSLSLSGLYAVYFGLLIGEVNAPPHFQPSAGTVKDTKKHVSPLGEDTWKHVFLFFYGCQRLQTSRTIPRLHFCLGAKEYVLIALHMKGFDVND